MSATRGDAPRGRRRVLLTFSTRTSSIPPTPPRPFAESLTPTTQAGKAVLWGGTAHQGQQAHFNVACGPLHPSPREARARTFNGPCCSPCACAQASRRLESTCAPTAWITACLPTAPPWGGAVNCKVPLLQFPAPRRERLHARQVFSNTACQEGLGSTPLGTASILHHSASVGSSPMSMPDLGLQPGRTFLISHSGLVASWHPFHLTTFQKRPHHLSRVLPTPVFHCCGNTGLL